MLGVLNRQQGIQPPPPIEDPIIRRLIRRVLKITAFAAVRTLCQVPLIKLQGLTRRN